MAKRPIRDLDVSASDGSPLPVLGTGANGRAAIAAIVFLVETFADVDVSADSELAGEIHTIATKDPTDARIAAQALTTRLDIDPVARNLIFDFANNFLLLGALEMSEAGRRQVIKYSYHWDSVSSMGRGMSLQQKIGHVWEGFLAGFGLSTFQLEVATNTFHSANSFHFECPAPSGLMINGIQLPKDDSGKLPTDMQKSSVGHVNGHYSESSTELSRPIAIRLEIDSTGILPRVALGSAMVLLFLAAVICWPNLYSSLKESLDSATAVLLTIPALLLGLNARSSENRISSRLLLPLRGSSVILAAVLFGIAGLLVISASADVAGIFASFCIIPTSLIFALSSVGWRELIVGRER